MQAATAADRVVRIRVDADGTIVAANPAFDAFAHDNGAPGLTTESVVGRPLSRFIVDDATRQWVDLLLRTTVEMRRDFTRLYRCDSPDTCRLIEMRLRPLAGSQGVEMEHRVVWTQPLPMPLTFTTRQQATAICRCSICNRLEIDGHWHQPETAPVPERVVAVHYGICGDCRAGRGPS